MTFAVAALGKQVTVWPYQAEGVFPLERLEGYRRLHQRRVGQGRDGEDKAKRPESVALARQPQPAQTIDLVLPHHFTLTSR
jgi:hypothetical protein